MNLSEWIVKRKEKNQEDLNVTRQDIDTAIKVLRYKVSLIESDDLRNRVSMEADCICDRLEKEAIKAPTYCRTEKELKEMYATILKQLTDITNDITKLTNNKKGKGR